MKFRLRSAAAIVWAVLLASPLLAPCDGRAAMAAPPPALTAADAALVRAGEAIYLRGELPSGARLQGLRENAVPGVSGAQAACVNCHRRSGLGSTHQSNGLNSKASGNQIPPIAGRYLFEGNAGHAQANLPYVDGMRSNRSPYTPATLARALREGIDADGVMMVAKCSTVGVTPGTWAGYRVLR